MDPRITVSLIKELIHRDGLLIALGGRTEATLEPLVSFIHRHLIRPAFAPLLLRVSQVILDLYEPVALQSMVIHDLLVKLRDRVLQELEAQSRMHQVLGLLKCLTA